LDTKYATASEQKGSMNLEIWCIRVLYVCVKAQGKTLRFAVYLCMASWHIYHERQMALQTMERLWQFLPNELISHMTDPLLFP